MSSLRSSKEVLLFTILSALISVVASMGVTTEDLRVLNVTCNNGPNTCQHHIEGEKQELTSGSPCHCDSSCFQLGTCCLDSPFRKRAETTEVAPCTSRYVGDNELQKPYFIIDKCPSNGRTNDAFQTQCEAVQNIEGDLMSIVPVTSLSSNMTYKNYFCFRCYEKTDDYIFWNVKVETDKALNISPYEEITPVYNKASKRWSVPVKGTLHPVGLSIEVPEEFSLLPRYCYENLISSCSENWPDDEIRWKCGLYMFLVYITESKPKKLYRNPHCALCNFETLEHYMCFRTFVVGFGGGPKPFSFTYLLDINRSNGEKVGEVQRCDENSMWDPYFKKCRKLVCAFPGDVVKDGKCTSG